MKLQKIILSVLLIAVIVLVAPAIVRGIPAWWSWYVNVFMVLLYTLAIAWLYQRRIQKLTNRRKDDTICSTQ